MSCVCAVWWCSKIEGGERCALLLCVEGVVVGCVLSVVWLPPPPQHIPPQTIRSPSLLPRAHTPPPPHAPRLTSPLHSTGKTHTVLHRQGTNTTHCTRRGEPEAHGKGKKVRDCPERVHMVKKMLFVKPAVVCNYRGDTREKQAGQRKSHAAIGWRCRTILQKQSVSIRAADPGLSGGATVIVRDRVSHREDT